MGWEAIDRVTIGILNRVTLASKRLCALVGAVGLREAARLALLEFRKSSSLQQVRVKGSPAMWVRIGRYQSDLQTLCHVWIGCCFEVPGLESPLWIVDAGANGGYSTRWFAERYPSATVIAIEPESSNVELLRKNTEHLPNVVILHAALMATPGQATLVDPGHGPWAFRVGQSALADGRVVGEVQCVSIASVMRDFNIDRIGLLKVDIEGGELEVFAASDEWIGKIDAVVAELHDRFRPGCTRAFIRATELFERDFVQGENVFALRSSSQIA